MVRRRLQYSTHELLLSIPLIFLATIWVVRGCHFVEPFPNRDVPISRVEKFRDSHGGEFYQLDFANGEGQTVDKLTIDRDLDMAWKVHNALDAQRGRYAEDGTSRAGAVGPGAGE